MNLGCHRTSLSAIPIVVRPRVIPHVSSSTRAAGYATTSRVAVTVSRVAVGGIQWMRGIAESTTFPFIAERGRCTHTLRRGARLSLH